MKKINEMRIINAAQDVLSLFHGSEYPLKNVAKDIIRARKLNSSERKLLLDLVFSWARESHLLSDFGKKNQPFYLSLSKQEKDQLALLILAKKHLGFILDDHISALTEQYNNYLITIGDQKYLIALGDLISHELIKSFAGKAQEIAQGLEGKAKKYLAFDQSKESSDEVMSNFKALGYELTPHPLMPKALALSDDADFSKLNEQMGANVWFMDAGSQIIAEALAPKPKDRVLDMCCGFGNKTRYLAMKECDLWAMDIDPRRLSAAKDRLKGWPVNFVCADGRNAPFTPESFDRILLDAPCSGIGVLRRNPDLIYRISKASLSHFCQLQRELLESALKLLRPGGLLVYATCSLIDVENKGAIDYITSKNKNLNVLSMRELFLDSQVHLLNQDLNRKFLELIPHIHDCDGFFIAGLSKIRE